MGRHHDNSPESRSRRTRASIASEKPGRLIGRDPPPWQAYKRRLVSAGYKLETSDMTIESKVAGLGGWQWLAVVVSRAEVTSYIRIRHNALDGWQVEDLPHELAHRLRLGWIRYKCEQRGK